MLAADDSENKRLLGPAILFGLSSDGVPEGVAVPAAQTDYRQHGRHGLDRREQLMSWYRDWWALMMTAGNYTLACIKSEGLTGWDEKWTSVWSVEKTELALDLPVRPNGICALLTAYITCVWPTWWEMWALTYWHGDKCTARRARAAGSGLSRIMLIRRRRT